jgi:hypothetical protein
MNSCDCGSMDARLSNVNPSGTERRSSGGSATGLSGPTTSRMCVLEQSGRNGCEGIQMIWTGARGSSRKSSTARNRCKSASPALELSSHRSGLCHLSGESFLKRPCDFVTLP